MDGDTFELGKRRTQVRHMAGLENLQKLELKNELMGASKVLLYYTYFAKL